jgi:hypothetical protein
MHPVNSLYGEISCYLSDDAFLAYTRLTDELNLDHDLALSVLEMFLAENEMYKLPDGVEQGEAEDVTE